MGRRLLEARAIGRCVPSSNRWLLRDVSLGIDGGDALAVCGPTGSGKTLLLRALAMLDPLDEGAIVWRGQAVIASAVPEFRRQVIYLHQRPALIEGTVEDNLRMPFQFKVNSKLHFSREHVSHLLASFGRDIDFLTRHSRDLSGGEAQIVALIRAIQLNPSVILLDEPTASLDASSTAQIEQIVSQWQGQNSRERAVVWVTHNREQATRVASKIIEVNSGRLI